MTQIAGQTAAHFCPEQACCASFASKQATGKAKPAKHTSAELAAKAAAALTNKGGGAAGKTDRLGGKAGSHAKFKCYVCAQMVPDMKTMQVHFEAKHPKMPYEADKVVDMHALMGGTTQGVAVRGSTKKK